jgi:ATPase subunit of ABC transporter with duplicated ATPase domains
MILGTIDLEQGHRWVGPGVVFGELGQKRQRLGSSETLMAGFLKATRMKTAEARSLLAKFGLGAAEIERGFGTLSPGERTRVELALLMAKGANCLVLDEPTNHLDLPAIEQLEAALESWQGTLLLVTHDRRLLESVKLTAAIELLDDGGSVRGLTRRSILPA